MHCLHAHYSLPGLLLNTPSQPDGKLAASRRFSSWTLRADPWNRRVAVSSAEQRQIYMPTRLLIQVTAFLWSCGVRGVTQSQAQS